MPFILIATELDLPGKMMALKMTLKRNLYGIFMNQHSIAIIEVGRLSLSLRVFPWCIVSKSKEKVQPTSGNGAPTVLACYLFLFFLCHDLFLLDGAGGSMFPNLDLISLRGGAGSLRLAGPGFQTLFSLPPVP